MFEGRHLLTALHGIITSGPSCLEAFVRIQSKLPCYLSGIMVEVSSCLGDSDHSSIDTWGFMVDCCGTLSCVLQGV